MKRIVLDKIDYCISQGYTPQQTLCYLRCTCCPCELSSTIMEEINTIYKNKAKPRITDCNQKGEKSNEL